MTFRLADIQIVKRDFLERSKTMLSNYHTYNDVYEITKQRRGPLRWFRDGHWKVILFELSGTTLTYSDDSQDERPSDAKAVSYTHLTLPTIYSV